MIAAWLALILALTTPAPAASAAGTERTTLHAWKAHELHHGDDPTERPAPADLADIDTWADGCTYTRIDATVVTARHCLPWNAHEHGWNTSGDRAWSGPEPDWVTPARGATVYGVGYPHATGRTVFALTVLHTTTVPVAGRQVPVLMTVGEGDPCTSGASGTVGWTTVDDVARPVGVLAVYSVDPEVTSLPAGQYVCGFAL